MTEATFDDGRPWLILCEGYSDKSFLERLITARGIENKFYIRFPDRGGEGTGGRSKFGHWLRTIHKTSQSFRDNINAVLILSDNDMVPADSFAEVRAQLTESNGFGIPNAERVVAKAKNYPDIVVLMIPCNEPGNLETLCLKSALNKWDIKTALDAFISATPSKDWNIGKQSKSRMQATLATHCASYPDTSFGNHWKEPIEYRVPLDHACFDEIAEFLSKFGELLAVT